MIATDLKIRITENVRQIFHEFNRVVEYFKYINVLVDIVDTGDIENQFSAGRGEISYVGLSNREKLVNTFF